MMVYVCVYRLRYVSATTDYIITDIIDMSTFSLLLFLIVSLVIVVLFD